MMSINVGRLSQMIGQSEKPKELKQLFLRIWHDLTRFHLVELD